MPRSSLVFLQIDGFEINDITEHSYQSKHAVFKFKRNDSNDKICIHLKTKVNKYLKLIYKNDDGVLQADTHLVLISVTCKNETITVHMEK